MNSSMFLSYGLHQSMFEFTKRKEDNIRIYGYSPSHDERVHITSLKVNIPDHMTSAISSVDIEDEINTLMSTQKLIRRAIKNNPKGFVDFIRNNKG